ncbi:GTPase ObgE [Candidatus Microgenomates bacterium]|nr:GTPase ObgE [Candidatus Microgenomates bacterium]
MFVDSVQVTVRAGKGGNGLASWRRERMVARGGPDGGDGGSGGSIIMQADHNLNTLTAFRGRTLITAENGQDGRHRKQHGKAGDDIVIKVPVGTVVSVADRTLLDLTRHGQIAMVAKGGRGGYGNAHFASSIRRAPDVAEVGEPGEQKQLGLELKLIADVGLVGLPNAGKSTLLAVVSNAKPKVAEYPFTTTSPNLGVVDVDEQSFLMADIPGLIEGASKGKGLGDEFLRHIERTIVILHLIDSTLDDAVEAWASVNQELKAYQVDLSQRPQLVVLTKIDTQTTAQVGRKREALAKRTKLPVFAISAVTHRGITSLLRATIRLMNQVRQKAALAPAKTTKIPRLTLADDPNAWWIEKVRGVYVVRGQKIEGFAKRTNFDSASGIQRLRDIMGKLGVTRELLRLGVKVGDRISISERTFKW